MPQITDILKNRQHKGFIKKEYRSYDINADTYNINTNTNSLDVINTQDLIADVQPLENKPSKANSLIETNTLVTDQGTVGEQLENKQETIREHLGNISITNREPMENKQITIGEQTDNNKLYENTLDKLVLNKNTSDKYLELSGLQKQATDLFVDLCVKNNSLQTGSIHSKAVAEYLRTTYGSLKTTLVRLVKKGIIHREQGKSSRAGYINIRLTSELIESSKKFRNNNILSFKRSDNSLDNQDIYSSNNKLTTTLTDEWKKINFEALNEIGFTATQLKQVVSFNNPEIVQHSINHFAYGLKFSEKTKSYPHPLNVLMGVLRKGEGWTEPGFKSSQEIAMEQYLENKKQNADRLTKLKDEIFDTDFREWFSNLSTEEKSNIFTQFKLPPNIKKSMSEEEAMALFKDHFKNNIFQSQEAIFA